MSKNNALPPEVYACFAFRKDDGEDRSLGWPPSESRAWIHLDRRSPEAARWIRTESGLDEISAEQLLTESTRPVALRHEDQLLLVLRGVNLNEGAEPEDMISIRLAVSPDRVVSAQSDRLRAVWDLFDEMHEGRGPRTPGSLVVAIARGLAARMSPVVGHIEELLDDLEDRVVDPEGKVERTELIRIRQQVIALHRYVAPQAETILRAAEEQPEVFSRAERDELARVASETERLSEALAAAKARAAVIQEELGTQIAETTNARVYVMTLVAVVFLPAGWVTGLLGMNVGGIPGAETVWAFWAVVTGLTVVATTGLLLMKLSRWF